MLASMVSWWEKIANNTGYKAPKVLNFVNKIKIENDIFRVYLLISDFPEKYLTHFGKILSVIMKSTRIWYKSVETIQLTAILKLQ